MTLSGQGMAEDGRRPVKCGTPAILEELRKDWSKGGHPFGGSGKGKEPQLTESKVSPSGKFTIYFTATGDSAASQDFVDFIATTADEAYNLEVNQLGYPKPPFTGPDSTYHIILRNLGNGVYGATYPITPGFGISPSGLGKYRSFMEIDNDFKPNEGYFTTGLDGARITVFHEFHHMIQFGSYGTSFTDRFLQEMTSVWFEMKSTPQVKDYLQYVPEYWKAIDLSFDEIPNIGVYGQGIWLQYVEKRFGNDAIREIWNKYSAVTNSPLGAIELALQSYQSTFCSEYLKFGSAIFSTGKRYHGESIFPDARILPSDALYITKRASRQDTSATFNALPASLNYILAGFGEDTAAVIVSRDTSLIVGNASVIITGQGTYRTEYDDPTLYCDTSVGVQPVLVQSFPQPFILQADRSDSVYILASAQSKQPIVVKLDIYSLSMSQIAHLEPKPTPYLNRYFALRNGKDDRGKGVASGIYLYTIETDGVKRTGKIAVVRKQ